MGWYERRVFNALMDARLDNAALRAERAALLAAARGDILELGIGTGLNLPHYPPSVERITALGPDPFLDRRAAERARARGIRVDYVAGDAARLPFDAGRFDTVVATLVLCTVAAPVRAVAEIKRALKPGGELLVFEHVARPEGWARALQRAFDPVNRVFACGCSLVRDTTATLREAGFSELALETRASRGMPLPSAWIVRGQARR
jgi:ubiquinone/menaquinone biosynthesis C-methylase UbiE